MGGSTLLLFFIPPSPPVGSAGRRWRILSKLGFRFGRITR